MKPRKPSDVMLGMLADFARKPIKARGEFSVFAPGDTCHGYVLRQEIDHYDQRRFNALLSRKFVAWFKRCACNTPCSCDRNGYHITAAGLAALPSKG